MFQKEKILFLNFILYKLRNISEAENLLFQNYQSFGEKSSQSIPWTITLSCTNANENFITVILYWAYTRYAC